MKRHIPAEYTRHGDEECVVCGARRVPRPHLWSAWKRMLPWRLDGKPAPYCPGKPEEKA